MKYLLAIDQGTTGSRAIIYDRKGRQVTSAYQEFPQYFPKPGWVEHDPEEIWQSVYSTIQKVLAKVPVSSIAAIGITNQRETTVIWDKNTGKPVHRAIVWQCRRTAERCDQLKRKKGLSGFIRKRTGLPIDAYFSATKIEWILNKVKSQKSKVLPAGRHGKNIVFGTTDTWILWKLTGGQSHATDYTNASRTMLFNIEKLKWDKNILKIFKIPESILPKVLPSSGNFGKTVKIGKLPAGIPITGIAGDQQAALFGQTCFESGTIKNTYGTGCFMLLNTGKKKVLSKYGLITTLACGPEGKVAYALEGSIFVAGAAVQWLRDQLGILKKSFDSEKMALSVKDNAGVYFVPAFVGLGAPYWDQNARGMIVGLTRGTNRNHLVRAALEAMCYSTKDVLETMRKDAGLGIRDLKVDGGAVANNFLCQFQADILRINIIRPKIIETTSLGAAYLAGLAVGFWKNSAEIKKFWRVGKIFNAQSSKAKADELYLAWKKAIRKCLGPA
ncbi:MAG: glycerol kinase GlpK [Candidatus Margulisbacteria bacterium]|nr:glycerol kinase GlpK [Candidatus Margulisiibacteriota bacterium]